TKAMIGAVVSNRPVKVNRLLRLFGSCPLGRVMPSGNVAIVYVCCVGAAGNVVGCRLRVKLFAVRFARLRAAVPVVVAAIRSLVALPPSYLTVYRPPGSQVMVPAPTVSVPMAAAVPGATVLLAATARVPVTAGVAPPPTPASVWLAARAN